MANRGRRSCRRPYGSQHEQESRPGNAPPIHELPRLTMWTIGSVLRQMAETTLTGGRPIGPEAKTHPR